MKKSLEFSSESKENSENIPKRVLLVKTIVAHPLKNDAFGVPLGLWTLKDFLKFYGYESDIFDERLELKIIQSDEERRKYITDGSLFREKIKQYEIICFSACSSEVPIILDRAKIAKSDKKITVVGGIFVYTNEKYLLNYDFIDFVIPHVGTFPLLRLLSKLNGERNIGEKALRGIFWSKNQDKFDNFSCDYEDEGDVSSLPIISRMNKSIIKEYKNYLDGKIDVITARGCNKACTFCSIRKESNKLKTIAENPIIEQICEYTESGFHLISIKDENFMHSETRSIYILNVVNKRIKQENLSVKFKIKSRIDSLLTENDMKKSIAKIEKLHDLGVREIQFGVESFDIPMRAQLLKRVDIEEKILLEFLKNVAKSGIVVNASFIIGLYNESIAYYKSLVNTMEKHFSDNQYFKIYMNFLTPHPFNGQYDFNEKDYYLVTNKLEAFNHKTPILSPKYHGPKERAEMLHAYDKIREFDSSGNYNPEIPEYYRNLFLEMPDTFENKGIEVYNGL